LRTDSDKCERSSETAVAFLGLAGVVAATLPDAAAFLSAVQVHQALLISLAL